MSYAPPPPPAHYSPQKPSATQAFWRATIMLGTLVVGGMAAYVYGPPKEKLLAWAEQALAAAKESFGGSASAELPTPPPMPSSLALLSETRAPGAGTPRLAGAAPEFSAPALAPTQVNSDVHAAEAMLGELAQLGAVDATTEPWGDSGHLHRFSCQMPLIPGDSAAGLVRHFDAFGATPDEAIRAGLHQVRDWRRQTGDRLASGR